ncbi:MAG: SDR family oxidoreductase [Mycobacteriaceae bacterium]|nr:SDR family oxidoreductase [Mycobacteriaceae bacterium]
MSGADTRTLAGRTVVVIGGSSGIGFEVATQVAEAGAEVTIMGRDEARLATAADKLGARTRRVDAHDEAELDAAMSDVGSVDHIVSMVGDSTAGGFLQTTPETMRHVLNSKFLTNWAIGRYAARALANGGSVTFTSGTGGRPHEIAATYVANLGIGALVQGLAREMAPHHRVNAVAPTFMGGATSFWRDVPAEQLHEQEQQFAGAVPLGRIATPGEVARAYVLLMTNQFITGQVVAVDGGIMLAK